LYVRMCFISIEYIGISVLCLENNKQRGNFQTTRNMTDEYKIKMCNISEGFTLRWRKFYILYWPDSLKISCERSWIIHFDSSHPSSIVRSYCGHPYYHSNWIRRLFGRIVIVYTSYHKRIRCPIPLYSHAFFVCRRIREISFPLLFAEINRFF
jgi:hypothetical protein